MFLIDLVEFNVSKNIPKIPLNKRSRDMSAKLLREARNLERGLRPPSKKTRITKPRELSIHAVAPSVLSKMGVNLPSMNSSDIPDLSNIKGKTASVRNSIINAAKVRGDTVSVLPKGGIELDKLYVYNPSKSEKSNRIRKLELIRNRKLGNEVLSDNDYRRSLRAIYTLYE